MSPAPASGNSFPKVSCIIPTLNAGSVLGVCLESIRRQDYPQEQIEIIAADGGSTDETLELARRHNAVVIRNERRIAEAGKEAAIAVMTGDYVLFVDADNELSSPDFVRLAVRALEANPGALGLESYYPASPRMGSFCVYLTQTLHIGDPVSWMMSVNPVLQGREGETERWTFPEGSKAFPLGANGFMYRRETLMSVNPGQDFEDTQIALRVADTGRTTWLRRFVDGYEFARVSAGRVDLLRLGGRPALAHLPWIVPDAGLALALASGGLPGLGGGAGLGSDHI